MDFLGDIIIEGEECFADAQDVGGKTLLQLDDAAGNEAVGGEFEQAAFIAGGDGDDLGDFAWLELGEGNGHEVWLETAVCPAHFRFIFAAKVTSADFDSSTT